MSQVMLALNPSSSSWVNHNLQLFELLDRLVTMSISLVSENVTLAFCMDMDMALCKIQSFGGKQTARNTINTIMIELLRVVVDLVGVVF